MVFPAMLSFTYIKQTECINWLKTVQYIVTEGQVEDFHAGEESVFTLGDYTLKYPDTFGSGCYYNKDAHSGPIYEGRQVRITHHQGKILRIEVADE